MSFDNSCKMYLTDILKNANEKIKDDISHNKNLVSSREYEHLPPTDSCKENSSAQVKILGGVR